MRCALASVLSSLLLVGCAPKGGAVPDLDVTSRQPLEITREFIAEEDGLHFIVVDVERDHLSQEVLCLFNIAGPELNRRKFGCTRLGGLDNALTWTVSTDGVILETNAGRAELYATRGYFRQSSIGRVIGWFCPEKGRRYSLFFRLNSPLPALASAEPTVMIGSLRSGVVSGLVANLDGPLFPRCSGFGLDEPLL